jgi:hypothetical protein
MDGNWLEQWAQRVKVGGEMMSDEEEVRLGVPQGMVFGPCLFTVFTDDIDACTVGITNIVKFADDTKC